VDVGEWLRNLGLERYEAAFRENDVSEADLPHLTAEDLQGIAVSTGSACSSGTLEPSPVILALGRTDEEARGSLRFSFGKDNTREEVDYVLEVLPRVVQRLRALSPLDKPRSLEPVAAE